MEKLAPLALFVYKRPIHTRRVLDALRACPELERTEIFVFSDGPKNEADRPTVEAVRSIVRSFGHPRMTFVESPANQGLAKSIIGGVARLCQSHGRVIVLEDDLVVSPAFLSYMNAALIRYAGEPTVWHVSGFVSGDRELNDRNEAFFLPYTHPWGWATWDRAWRHFDHAVLGWETFLNVPANRRAFDLGGIEDYSGMLRQQWQGRIDSWWICWYFTAFKGGGLGLFPPRSLVQSIGMDPTATHGWITAWLLEPREPRLLLDLPTLPKTAIVDDRNFGEYKRSMRPIPRRILRITGKIKRTIMGTPGGLFRHSYRKI